MKVNFTEVFDDITKFGRKISSDNYLIDGKFPIIDQGKDFIAGYSNDETGAITDLPVIVFGDHTRILKYVDIPFLLGADGVKVLRCKRNDFNIKYLYYCLCSADIPNTGYNRHFKWLKDLNIEVISYNEQTEIVDVLDKINDLIEKRKQQLEKLDLLVKSQFIEMFGIVKYPVKKWNDVFDTTTGKLDSNAMVENGKYPFFTCSKEVLRINTYAYDQEALLLAGNNAAGKYDVKHYCGKFNAYQRTYILTLKNGWSYKLFKCQLEKKLDYLQTQSLGGLTKYLTLKILSELEFIVPPLELQNEFSNFVEQTEKSKLNIKKSIEKLETLKKALMQKYFG